MQDSKQPLTSEETAVLALTHRTDQTILIADPQSEEAPVEITIVGVISDQVRIGIKAPRTVTVHQNEIYQ